MPRRSYIRNIVPIGALFSASLVFSNLAYITLSVSFIQMYVTSSCSKETAPLRAIFWSNGSSAGLYQG
jgi:hypothetical protein